MKTVNPSTQLRINGERSRTIKFYTLGCKVNQYDTQSIRHRFIQKGFTELYNGMPADVCVVNTCTVTSIADRKSRQLIKSINRENPRAKIIVTGCLVQKDIASVAAINGVDIIIPKKFFPEGIDNFSKRTRAFLKIQDGCDNFCSYCKVPYVRGRSRSRDLSKIIAEARSLAGAGFKEVVLCGICLGAYGKDKGFQSDLVEVIDNLEHIDGLMRIRLSSIEPGDINDDLIEKISKSHKLCPHLHIPLQSGSDEILKKMNRNYNRNQYLELINKIRQSIPDIAITTDVLVGFPGEDKRSFEDTVDLIKRITPLKVHIFPYSLREGTVAAREFKSTVPQSVLKQRISSLKRIAQKTSFDYRKQFLNKYANVLIEEDSGKKDGFCKGWTDRYMKVLVESTMDFRNSLIRVKLLKISADAVIAKPC